MANDDRSDDRARDRLLAVYETTRARTETLASRLTAEDQQLQSMPDASPTKWHRAHTTWFFEAFLLGAHGVEAVDPRYAFLFNSYYEAEGARHPRPSRGLLSRPSAVEIADYRRRVDERVVRAVRDAGSATLARMLPVLELGIAHEEQHQELLLTDILHAFSVSPLEPPYLKDPVATPPSAAKVAPLRFVTLEGGLCEVGAPARSGFAFDNEEPRHKRWLEPFALADRLVTIRELKAFMDEDGYRRPSLWLAEGFDFIREHAMTSPLYTRYESGQLDTFTLAGRRTPRDEEPIAHLSYYEADAIARYLGARLPTEAEWEHCASLHAVRGNFAEDGVFHPRPCDSGDSTAPAVRQIFGDAWEWTSSGYEPYPGYRVPQGALGEYNGKFMVSQIVLRGGSCLTPRRHMRASYRNFWHPRTRFQMAGVRLARGIA